MNFTKDASGFAVIFIIIFCFVGKEAQVILIRVGVVETCKSQLCNKK